jgi:hypothetical protein
MIKKFSILLKMTIQQRENAKFMCPICGNIIFGKELKFIPHGSMPIYNGPDGFFPCCNDSFFYNDVLPYPGRWCNISEHNLSNCLVI